MRGKFLFRAPGTHPAGTLRSIPGTADGLSTGHFGLSTGHFGLSTGHFGGIRTIEPSWAQCGRGRREAASTEPRLGARGIDPGRGSLYTVGVGVGRFGGYILVGRVLLR
jgi:hypothetical protein